MRRGGKSAFAWEAKRVGDRGGWKLRLKENCSALGLRAVQQEGGGGAWAGGGGSPVQAVQSQQETAPLKKQAAG